MAINRAAIQKIVQQLVRQRRTHRRDIQRGVQACARIWDRKAGTPALLQFCERHYVPPGEARQRLLQRLDALYRTIHGSMTYIRKHTRAGLDIADGPLTPAEELLGAFTISSHLQEDYRRFQVAHLVQLNFGTEDLRPPTTREGWVERRLADWGREMIPARLTAHASTVMAEVDAFVSSYNLHLDRIDFGDPNVRFPEGTRCISHWGLRDYMMGLYDDPHGLAKQRAILELMRMVVDGEIPAEVLDNPAVRWSIPARTICQNGDRPRPARGHGPLRWAQFRKLFHALRACDPYTRYGNMIDTKFLEDREMPEPRVRKILTDILGSPVAAGVGRFLAQRLGRPLEPFDIYFKRFVAGTQKAPLGFDLAQRYPSASALQAAIPEILGRLGFDADRARAIGSKIRVDNGRGAGHAWSPGLPHDPQLLRVRVPAEGINEIEFGTYMHELGHCVEGVLSSYGLDYQSLWGIPNSALTEAFAFTFQDRSDEMLGRPRQADPLVMTLQRFWEAFEIAAPALVEMDFFHWLYQHPKATAVQMQQAIRTIGDRIWQRYHAKIFGPKSFGLPSVYSHMLWCDLYLADYPLGYVCAYQIRSFLRDKNLGEEMPRMCRVGRIYPDAWMQHAVGAPIDARPLLQDTAAALKALNP